MKKLLTLIVVLLGFSLLFEYLFQTNIKLLRSEAQTVPQRKVSTDTTVIVYPQEKISKPVWILKGKKVNFKRRNITFTQFFAKNIPQNFTVKSKEADFSLSKELIFLSGDVDIAFTDNGKLYHFYTQKATVNMKKHFIFGNSEVLLVGNNRTLKGNSFYYDYKNGIFEVKGNVTTILNH